MSTPAVGTDSKGLVTTGSTRKLPPENANLSNSNRKVTPASPLQPANLSDDKLNATEKNANLNGSTGRFSNEGQPQIGRLQKENSGRLSANDQSDEAEEMKYDGLLEEWTEEWYRRHRDSEPVEELLIQESSEDSNQESTLIVKERMMNP